MCKYVNIYQSISSFKLKKKLCDYLKIHQLQDERTNFKMPKNRLYPDTNVFTNVYYA